MKMNDEGQWIILIAFLVSIAIFFLAFVLNQSTVIGQTTAEGVLEFPKNDIKDIREEIFRISEMDGNSTRKEMIALAFHQKNAIVDYKIGDQVIISGSLYRPITIHYNNGVTEYDETIYY
jgi:hypothetical protein